MTPLVLQDNILHGSMHAESLNEPKPKKGEATP